MKTRNRLTGISRNPALLNCRHSETSIRMLSEDQQTPKARNRESMTSGIQGFHDRHTRVPDAVPDGTR